MDTALWLMLMSGGGALDGASRLLEREDFGLAIDFTDQSARIKEG